MADTKNLLSNKEVITALGLPKNIMTALGTQEGDTFTATVNDVLNAVNKIAYQKVEKMNFSDPFKKFDGRPITYGSTIENIWIQQPDGYKYDKDATDPFAKQANKNKVLYAYINYDMQYQTTIQKDLMKRAVLNEGGLMELINYITESVGTGAEVDTYEATIRMLNNPNLYANGFEELDVSGVMNDAKAKAKKVARKIKDVVTDFALPCSDNNKLKVKNVCPKEHSLLVIKQELLNDIDWDFLEGVYNLSKVDLGTKIIPVRDFRTISNDVSTPSIVGDDLAFIVLDDRGFDNHMALRDSGAIYNPKGRYFNQFTDVWKIIAYKYWFNARAFKLKTTA